MLGFLLVFAVSYWMSRKGLIDFKFLKHTIFRKRVIFSRVFQERESDLKISYKWLKRNGMLNDLILRHRGKDSQEEYTELYRTVIKFICWTH